MLSDSRVYCVLKKSVDCSTGQRGMRGMGQDTQQRKPWAYRLRDSVQYHQNNGSPVLVLAFPLKVIILHSFWRPVFESCKKKDFIAFNQIVSLVPHVDPREVEIFLNSLVRKGFLEQEGIPSISYYPYVSVIVPVRNRPTDITTCLQSLSRLDYPAEKMEVIVVDDASDDNTPEVVSTFALHLIRLKVHRQASYCRNRAAQRAKGEILAFLDSDCVVDPQWLKELIPAFADPSNGAVGGVVDSYRNTKVLDRYEKVKSSLTMGSWPKSSHEEKNFFYLPSCNLLVRRTLFQQLGGFREDVVVGEDVDFCWRLQDQGHHLEYRPVGTVYHKHRNSMRYFCSRRFDYGISEPLLQKTHAKRIKQFLFSLRGCIFWCLIFLSIAIEWLPLLGLCGVLVVADSLIKLTKTRKKKVPIRLPCLLLSTVRSYCAFFYHCCAFVSRYYLFCAAVFLIVAPLVSAIVFCMHLLTGIVEYFIKKPRLSIPTFLFYFTLDQLAYQLGVWWGCLKMLCFRPINPYLVRKSFYKVLG
jgi:mycofactocin system glycosyltransferase